MSAAPNERVPSEAIAPAPFPGGGTGGGLREVVVLAVPAILTQLSMTVMGFIDSAMVGRLGATELGAVGFASIWVWTLFNFFFGLASATQTFVAQAWGADRERECGSWAWQGFYLVVPSVVGIAGTVALTAAPLLAWLGPSAELQRASVTYVLPVLAGAPGLGLAFVLASFFRGFGDTRTPLYATLVANALNAVLDYGLIFGKLGLPELGLAGAGVATAIGQWVYGGYLLVAFLRRPTRERFATGAWSPSRDRMRRVLRTGLPIGGEWVIGMLSFAVFSTVIARMGDTSAAASQAFIVLLSFSFMQAIGISVAASTLVGRYVGADDPGAARRSFRSAQKLAAGLAIATGAVFIAFPELLIRVFSSDPEVVAVGRALVVVGAVFQFCDAFGIVAGGALRGAGDTRWPFVVHTLFAWLVFVPLAYVLGVVLDGGALGAWIAGTVYVALLTSVLLLRFWQGAWEQIEI